jgi:hypothetical protein
MKNCKTEYIDDDGFTARVMAVIPRDRQNAGTNRRYLLLVSACLLAVVLVVCLGGPDFIAGLSAAVQFAASRPALIVGGVGLGALPMACLAAGLCMAAGLGYRHLRQAFR